MTGSMKRWMQEDAAELNSKRYRIDSTIKLGTTAEDTMVPMPDQTRFDEALEYLKVVRDTLEDESKYREFLQILKDFQNEIIDTALVVSLVKKLFNGHMAILVGFNAFLPRGYKVVDPSTGEACKETCEEENLRRKQRRPAAAKDEDVRALESSVSHQDKKRRMSFDDAVNFVNKVKLRFCDKEEYIYTEFLEILNRFRQGTPIWECTQMISALFREHADLILDFHNFVPAHLRPHPSQSGASSRPTTEPVPTQPNPGSAANASSASTTYVRRVQDDFAEKSSPTSPPEVDQVEVSQNASQLQSTLKMKKQRKRTDEDADKEGAAAHQSIYKRQRKQTEEQGESGHSTSDFREQGDIDFEDETDVVAERVPFQVQEKTKSTGEDEEEAVAEHLPVDVEEQFTKTLEERLESKASTVRKQAKEEDDEPLQFYHRIRGSSSQKKGKADEVEGGEAPEQSSPEVQERRKKTLLDRRDGVVPEYSPTKGRKQRKKNPVDEEQIPKTYHRARGLSGNKEPNQLLKGEEADISEYTAPQLNGLCNGWGDVVAQHSLAKERNFMEHFDSTQGKQPGLMDVSLDRCKPECRKGAGMQRPVSHTLLPEESPKKATRKHTDRSQHENDRSIDGNASVKNQGGEPGTEESQQAPSLSKKMKETMENDVDDVVNKDTGDVRVEGCVPQVSLSDVCAHGMKSNQLEEQNRRQIDRTDGSESEESGKEVISEKAMNVSTEKIPPKRASARIAVEMSRKKLQAAEGMPALTSSPPVLSMEEQQRIRLQQFEEDRKNALLQQMQCEFYEQIKKTLESCRYSPELPACLQAVSTEVINCEELKYLVIDAMEEQELEYSQCKRSTPSYYLLPKSFLKPLTDSRTKRIQEVLNDCWVSVGCDGESKQNPFDEGVGARKQIGRDGAIKRVPHDQRLFHEEKLSQCEDDQYELDVLLATTANTIERVAHMVKLTQAEGFNQESFNWDKYLTPVNLRCIERLYCEFGVDFIEQARKNSIVSLPIILRRLQHKGENEWPEYRMEMNKIWAEVHSEHYQKSQDYSQSQDMEADEMPTLIDNLPEELDFDEEQKENCNLDPSELCFEHPDAENVHQIIKYLLMEIRMTEEQLKKIKAVWAEKVDFIFNIPNGEDGKEESDAKL